MYATFLYTGSKLESLELGDCQSENKAIRHKRPCITGMLAQVSGVIGALNTLYKKKVKKWLVVVSERMWLKLQNDQ